MEAANHCETCDDAITRVYEPWLDPYLAGDMWLVRGRDLDLLVDCGTGIMPLLPVIGAVTRNPVLAVACNCWYDHAGGLHEFTQRGCHRAEAERIVAPTADSSVASIYVSDEMLLALPHAGYSTQSYRMQASEPTHVFDDGDLINLGDRSLEVLHVPGMTAGSIALWEHATGSLFTSDTLFDDPAPESRAKYRAYGTPDLVARTTRLASLERLIELPFKTIYAGHFGRIRAKRAIELIAAIRA